MINWLLNKLSSLFGVKEEPKPVIPKLTQEQKEVLTAAVKSYKEGKKFDTKQVKDYKAGQSKAEVKYTTTSSELSSPLGSNSILYTSSYHHNDSRDYSCSSSSSSSYSSSDSSSSSSSCSSSD